MENYIQRQCLIPKLQPSVDAKTITTVIQEYHEDSIENKDDRTNNLLAQKLSFPFTVIIMKLRKIIAENLPNTIDAKEEFQQTVQFLQANLSHNRLDTNYHVQIGKHYSYNDFVIKFNLNIFPLKHKNSDDDRFIFKLISSLSHQTLSTIINNNNTSKDFNNQIIIEFPFNMLNHLWGEQQKQQQNFKFRREHLNFKIDSLSIGSIVNLNSFVNRLDALTTMKNFGDYPQMELNFSKKLLAFHFHVNHAHVLYRVEINFVSIRFLLLESISNPDRHRFYLELNAVPFLYQSTQTPISNRRSNLKHHPSKIYWERISDFGASFSPKQNMNKHSEKFVSNHNTILKGYDPELFAYALSYRIDMGPSEKDLNSLVYLCYVCKDLNRNFSFYINGGCGDVNCRRIQEISPNSINLKYSMSVLSKLIDQYFVDKSYAILYACRVLFLKSYKIIDSLVLKKQLTVFFQQIQDLLMNEDESLIEECLYSLDVQFKINPVLDLMVELSKIYQDKKRFNKTESKPILRSFKQNDHVIMRQAILTPTRIEFCRPMPMLRSRFSNIANLDYSLRLTLLEDNNRLLNRTFSDTKFIKTTIKPRLLKGIQVGDRLFEFLGSSSSQMRENGIVFYAKDDMKRTAQSIRDLVGNFSNFKRKVAKYIARFGLVFSQAIAYYKYGDSVKLYKTGDFKTVDQEFCFSDGIGIISKNIAEKIVPLLRLPYNYFPSAFQIRHGGCKGMLVCYETKEEVIIFRESMIKYESNDNNLGILKFSAPRLVTLNRPLINILDQQWVPAKVFYEIFASSTETIMKALLFDHDAFNLMRKYRNSNLPYSKLFKAGFSFLREPFLRRTLNYLVFYRMNDFKTKARIPIPESNGRMAFGVIDEKRELNSGEIFFQYSELDSDGQPTGQTVILENQEVMVTKFPCLSLGDVRKFRAVNVLSLKHIKDCLVFPAKGPRPHTDEMGGSDLDGDEYAIFWQSKLIFPGKNYQPMDFISQSPGELNHDINLDDIVTFYCDYLLENNIGQVANCHLMYSDFHPQGLRSKECKELANKYSISLDFQKNGVNSQLEKKYKPNCKWIRPDFMEKRDFYKSYLSEKILGQFYRHCSLVEAIIRTSDEYLFANEENRLEKPDPKLILDGWRQFELEATEAFIEYSHKLIDTMEMMVIDSESALFNRIYEDKGDVSLFIFDQLFQYFQEKFESQSKDKTERERLLLISAWYSICFEKSSQLKFQYHSQSLLGLPFMVPNEMIKLVKASATLSHLEPHSLTIELFEQLTNEKIMEFTTSLILSWMKRLNQIILNDNYNDQFEKIIHIFQYESNCWETIQEQALFEHFIRTKLESILKDIDKEYKETITANLHNSNSLTLIWFLFNRFMLHLYGMCNSVENFITEKKFTELFMIRYAMFALNFVNKLNLNEISSYAIDGNFQNIGGDDLHNLKRRTIDQNTNLKSIFVSCLEVLFDRLLIIRKPDEQKKQEFQFCVLNNNSYLNENPKNPKILKFDFNKLDEKFFLKLKFLTGAIVDMKIFDQDDNCIYTLDSTTLKMVRRQIRDPIQNVASTNNLENNFNSMGCNLKRLKISYFTLDITVTTSLFQSSTTIITFLKLLLGHPEFYHNIYNRFDLEFPSSR